MYAAAAAAKSFQSCLTLCDPIDSSPPGSAIPGILQTRILEWVAISFSKAWKSKVKVKSLSCVRLLVTPWTAAYQAPPSMGFARQEYWSGVPLLSPSLMYTHSFMFWRPGFSFTENILGLIIDLDLETDQWIIVYNICDWPLQFEDQFYLYLLLL